MSRSRSLRLLLHGLACVALVATACSEAPVRGRGSSGGGGGGGLPADTGTGDAAPDDTGGSDTSPDDTGAVDTTVDDTSSDAAADTAADTIGDTAADTAADTGTLPPTENCSNGVDDDLDRAIDCLDPDCAGAPICASFVEDCADGRDNDRDGAIDCGDADCAANPDCAPDFETSCSDGRDNDRDGAVDCEDLDCAGASNCFVPAESCANGLDDDRDGAIDCADGDCTFAAACTLSGACNNFNDLTALSGVTYDDITNQCLITCLTGGAAPIDICFSDCVSNSYGTSQACGDCFGATASCGFTTCNSPCFPFGGTPECSSCVQTSCGPDFEVCAGIPIPL